MGQGSINEQPRQRVIMVGLRRDIKGQFGRLYRGVRLPLLISATRLFLRLGLRWTIFLWVVDQSQACPSGCGLHGPS